jgi:hypothetical protein
MQGHSLKPLIERQTASWRTAFYYDHLYDTENSKVYLPKCEGLVTGQYKYMRYFNGKDPDNFFYEELYNQQLDPFEVFNQANSARLSGLKNEMIEKMKALRTSLK